MEECTNFMYQLRAEKHKGEPLKAMNLILRLLDNPHEKVPFVHIAGSNGKGSTANYLKEILTLSNVKVGAFISPHFERVNERITINGVEIPDERFLALSNQLFDIIETHLRGEYPSFFELMTIISFMYFAEEQVDIAIVEAGIGGRFDCTNVIHPLVSIITTISLEHTEILGETFEQVAYQKAGIIKKGIPIITAVKHEEALKVIEAEAEKNFAPIFKFGEDFLGLDVELNHPYHQFTYQLGEVKLPIQLSMQGLHQIANACTAITAATILRSSGFIQITDQFIQTALQKATWPGRFELFNNQIILDGAHNLEGVTALIDTLTTLYPNKKYKFIYSVMKDKDYEQSIPLLENVASKIYYTELPVPRAAKAKELLNQSKHPLASAHENWTNLLEQEILRLKEDDVLIITGSLYFIAEVRKYLITKEEV